MGKIAKMQEVTLSELKPYENNAKIHNAGQIEKLKASIKEFGFLTPCIIDADYNLIAGHGRVMAAKELGMKTVPCVFVDDITEEQRRAYILADNRLGELGEWDMDLVAAELTELAEQGFDIDLTGFCYDETVIDNEPIDDSDLDEDFKNFVDSLSQTRTESGQLWKLGNHRLKVGDSTNLDDVLALVGGGKIDLLETDPPYNVNIENADGMKIANDNMGDSEFNDFLYNAFSNACTVMREGAAFYIWHADSNGLAFRLSSEKAGLKIRENLIWVKSRFSLGRQDYQWRHEPCLYGWKEGAAHYFTPKRNISTIIESIDRLENASLEDYKKFVDDIKETSSILYADTPTKDDLHPTMKPVELIERQIKNSTKQGESVLDLFGGSGTTLIACEQLGRKCYMMEYDPKYADVIIGRWEEMTNQKAELIVE